ncbi:hypothetical protein EII25_05070 [Erysipelotrichaceae bacterium OH741_COT-311]|nr:hypothetical protein EII25_05070 [Erysipelotrichaceae bacterium OH741_COT-311]
MIVVDEIMNAFIDIEFQNELQRKRIDIEKILKDYIKKLARKKVSKEVNSRIKSEESLREKLERKDYINQWGIKTSNNKEIQRIVCEKLPDLIGFRLNCYFKEDEKNIFEELIKHLKEMDCIEIEEFPNTKQKNGHEIYKIACKYKELDEKFSFEVQVKSLLNDVWGEVEHSTIYKSRVYDSRAKLKKDMVEGLYHILDGADTQLNRLYSFSVELKEIKQELFFKYTLSELQNDEIILGEELTLNLMNKLKVIKKKKLTLNLMNKLKVIKKKKLTLNLMNKLKVIKKKLKVIKKKLKVIKKKLTVLSYENSVR